VGVRATREPTFFRLTLIRKAQANMGRGHLHDFKPKAIFQRADKYDGVRPINIYLLRLLYTY